MAGLCGCSHNGNHVARIRAGDSSNGTSQNGPHLVVDAQGVSFKWHSAAPNGQLRMVADVKAESGAVDGLSRNSQLRSVTVLLYKSGSPAARLAAPEVHAADRDRVLRASGGVRLVGMRRYGLVVTARNVNWYSKQNRVEAFGEVRFYSPGEYTKGIVVRAGPYPRVNFDTSLESFSVP